MKTLQLGELMKKMTRASHFSKWGVSACSGHQTTKSVTSGDSIESRCRGLAECVWFLKCPNEAREKTGQKALAETKPFSQLWQ